MFFNSPNSVAPVNNLSLRKFLEEMMVDGNTE